MQQNNNDAYLIIYLFMLLRLLRWHGAGSRAVFKASIALAVLGKLDPGRRVYFSTGVQKKTNNFWPQLHL